MRARFGITPSFDFYSDDDLLSVLRRSGALLQLPGLDETSSADSESAVKALRIIACRSRGTPRIANRLLRRVRDFTQVKSDGRLTPQIVDDALKLEGVDDLGLDELDRKYLNVIGTVYEGGPVGLEAIAATLGEDSGTLEDVVEPYLLQVGFLARTRKGRQLTGRGSEHLGFDLPRAADQSELFEGQQGG